MGFYSDITGAGVYYAGGGAGGSDGKGGLGGGGNGGGYGGVTPGGTAPANTGGGGGGGGSDSRSGGGSGGSGIVIVKFNTSPPVNGGWSSWLTCSATCNGGTQTRSCNNPTPANGGLQCQLTNGSYGLNESQVCNTQSCCTPTCSFTSSQVSSHCTNEGGGPDGCGGTCAIGTKAPSYGNYNCIENSSEPAAFCSIASNCGLSKVTSLICTADDGCGNSNESRPTQECLDNGICPTPSIINCPGCQLKIKAGGFIEVAP